MLLSALRHHGEPADPDLVQWVLHRLDALLGLGHLTVVVALGILLVLVPVIILGAYAIQRSRAHPEGD